MNQADLQKIFDILSKISKKHDDAYNFFPKIKSWHDWLFYVSVLFLPLLSVLTAAVLKYFELKHYYTIPFFLIVAAYVFLVAYSFFISKREMKEFKNKGAIGSLLATSENDCIDQLKTTNELLSISLSPLKHAKRYILCEKLSYEKRIGLIVGAIDKTGAIPGLIALFYAWHQIQKDNPILGSGLLSFALLILYAVSIRGHFLLQRVEQYLLVLESVINEKETKSP